jgi:hypothetical protein
LTGEPTPTALPGRYARVTLTEVRELRESHGLSLKWAVWLAVHAYTGVDGESGRVWASLSAGEAAKALGVSRRAVHNAVGALISCGALELVRRGGNGRASVYALPMASPEADTTTPSNYTQLLPRTSDYSKVVTAIPGNYSKVDTAIPSNYTQLLPRTSSYSKVVTTSPHVLTAETCRKERLNKSFFIGDLLGPETPASGIDAVNASLLDLETERARARLKGGALGSEGAAV